MLVITQGLLGTLEVTQGYGVSVSVGAGLSIGAGKQRLIRTLLAMEAERYLMDILREQTIQKATAELWRGNEIRRTHEFIEEIRTRDAASLATVAVILAEL